MTQLAPLCHCTVLFFINSQQFAWPPNYQNLPKTKFELVLEMRKVIISITVLVRKKCNSPHLFGCNYIQRKIFIWLQNDCYSLSKLVNSKHCCTIILPSFWNQISRQEGTQIIIHKTFILAILHPLKILVVECFQYHIFVTSFLHFYISNCCKFLHFIQEKRWATKSCVYF